MNKIFLSSVFICTLCSVAHAVNVPWWLQPTICKISPKNCYIGMGAGYDSEMWDANNNCWGMKLICPDALVADESEPRPMGRNEIAAGKGIKTDYDVNVLNGDCFGVRATKDVRSGTLVSVNGKFVKLWCSGVLNKPDEEFAEGDVAYDAPKCAELAKNGFVGVANGKCYGKYFDENEYFIDCAGAGELPTRIVILNGADWTKNIIEGVPYDKAVANKTFNEMYSISTAKHKEYFKE